MSRVFTLQEAQATLPRVRTMTRHAFELSVSLAEELQELERTGQQVRCDELRGRIESLVQSWTGAIQDLDAQAKGLWLVDFDAGDGCWCWAYPEEDVTHWHSYEGGFSSRIPLALRPAERERVRVEP